MQTETDSRQLRSAVLFALKNQCSITVDTEGGQAISDAQLNEREDAGVIEWYRGETRSGVPVYFGWEVSTNRLVAYRGEMGIRIGAVTSIIVN